LHARHLAHDPTLIQVQQDAASCVSLIAFHGIAAFLVGSR